MLEVVDGLLARRNVLITALTLMNDVVMVMVVMVIGWWLLIGRSAVWSTKQRNHWGQFVVFWLFSYYRIFEIHVNMGSPMVCQVLDFYPRSCLSLSIGKDRENNKSLGILFIKCFNPGVIYLGYTSLFYRPIMRCKTYYLIHYIKMVRHVTIDSYFELL